MENDDDVSGGIIDPAFSICARTRKRVGIQGLPWDLKFVYAYMHAHPSLMSPPPHAFVLVCGRGPIGVGKFDYVSWHKKERDDLLREWVLKGILTMGRFPIVGVSLGIGCKTLSMETYC